MPLAIRGTYTYAVPAEMDVPAPGMRVLVPLAQKQVVGVIDTDPADSDDLSPDRIRPLLAVLDLDPVATDDQLRLWHWIADYYMCPLGDVLAAALPARAFDRQYTLSESAHRRVRLPEYSGEVESAHALDDQQQQAVSALLRAWDDHDICLLHGVTSSGKTEVYIHLIREQLRLGRQVLYLVPEIALTTQLTDRLQRVFGAQLLVYHSRITEARRMETYRRLLLTHPDEPPRVIIGARSAIFLPLHRLGLVIVDEEHEPSYKQQDPAPRYHARSVAVMLSRLCRHEEQVRVLLGSATPAVETYYLAQTGRYGLVEMTRRFRGLCLPETTLIDLQRQYHRREMYGHFADPLVDRIRRELGRGKQVILFQNRRGYAPYMECTQCGHSPQCPDCDVSMTVHMRSRSLRCHYCGAESSLPSVCPKCGAPLRICGLGTERIEEEVQTLFPEARTLRMDLDTTRRGDDYRRIIDAFSRHECDILIGTQMVTKGLHFDDVSLVAVLGADTLLNTPDFRAYERAFQMLEQVSGRAGRTAAGGEVVIQTFDTERPLFRYLSEHDYRAFFEEQLQERRQFHFPPFCRLFVLTMRHSSADRVETAARLLCDALRAVFADRCSPVLVPSVERVMRMHVRSLRLRIESTASVDRARAILRQTMDSVLERPECRGVMIQVDVDPQ